MALPLALLPLLCCLGGERLPALSTICFISSIAKLVFERLFALHSFVLTYSVVIVHGAGDIRLLFKLLLKFRNVLKHTESRSSLACNQSIKEDIPTALEVFLCFETKQYKLSTKSSTQRASNIRGRTGYNV